MTSSASVTQVSEIIRTLSDEMRLLLQDCIRIPSVSGKEASFVQFIEQWARREGLVTDIWETSEVSLGQTPWPMDKHIPLAGRPTLVIRLPGQGGGPNLLFNAHADVVGAPEPDTWQFGPWSAHEHNGRIYGRGACDVKGPLVSALWAMKALQQAQLPEMKGDILLELIPGEEDCVGLGTLTSHCRGYRADGVIILEPTENLPRCASRAGCRFEILVRGRAVHGTVKWLGKDAIQTMHNVLGAVSRLEQRWNTSDADTLFMFYPILRPMSVDFIHGGRWQGMVCDLCTCAGYLELLPEDNLEQCKQRFADEIIAEVMRTDNLAKGEIEVRFSEQYPGHSTDPEHPLCRVAEDVIRSHIRPPRPFMWAGFNSGCEAGLRFAMDRTPTLVWGPGTLAEAHAVDESVAFEDVQQVALMFSSVCQRWSRGQDLSR